VVTPGRSVEPANASTVGWGGLLIPRLQLAGLEPGYTRHIRGNGTVEGKWRVICLLNMNIHNRYITVNKKNT